jgi:hypothetical protein
MITVYVVVRIGCIECGVSSDVVGVFETRDEADKVCDSQPSTWDSEGGDGYHHVFERVIGVNHPNKYDRSSSEDE